MLEIDQVIWNLWDALYRAHPVSGKKPHARRWLEVRANAENAAGRDPLAFLETIKRNHPLWIEHWRRLRLKSPGCFVPYLVTWLEDEEWPDPPKDGLFTAPAPEKPVFNPRTLPR